MTTVVIAPARLHFGLLRVTPDAHGRNFGGCGLMIDQPRVAVAIQAADQWSAMGPNADRAAAFARRVTTHCQRITVTDCPPAHAGFGSGTALALAVAKALQPEQQTEALARLVGRGARSGIGLRGFESGGFLAEGSRLEGEWPPLRQRIAFPVEWRIVLLMPSETGIWHGAAEREAFERHRDARPGDAIASEMTALLNDEMIPSLQAADAEHFGEALHQYNRLAGAVFAKDQGGHYAGDVVAGWVQFLQQCGIRGVGQSSWGPCVFAVTTDEAQADWLCEQIHSRSSGIRTTITRAATSGYRMVREPA